MVSRGFGVLLALAGSAWAVPNPRVDTESLFLDMSKINLGRLRTEEEKRQYLKTIQLEKARITRKTLRAVYDNAYDLYKDGDYEGTKELTGKILSIDPAFQDAAMLQRASAELKGSKHRVFSERKLVDDKLQEGMALYRQGRVVEAAQRWEEATKLAPANLRARYWLKKARNEIADEHFRRGQKAYRQRRLRDALDQWYAALLLNPRYPRLVGAIAKAESELREAEGNEKLQAALALYSQGRSEECLKALGEVLELSPGDARAQKLIAEIRLEIANGHIAEGRKLYLARKYLDAIAQWKKAVTYGYDSRSADQLIGRAREQMRREAEAKRLAEELAKQRAEEAKRRQEEEARRQEEDRRKAEEEAKKAMETPGAAGAGASLGGTVTEQGKRSAVTHWNNGMIYFSKGDYEKARDEWTLCRQLDPTNVDCDTGLKRIDQQYGGP